MHSIVNKYCGNPNKNIGEAFLIVWKFPNEFIFDEILVKSHAYIEQLTDMALVSALKILISLYTNESLLAY